jgi:hypothetical protein
MERKEVCERVVEAGGCSEKKYDRSHLKHCRGGPYKVRLRLDKRAGKGRTYPVQVGLATLPLAAITGKMLSNSMH